MPTSLSEENQKGDTTMVDTTKTDAPMTNGETHESSKQNSSGGKDKEEVKPTPRVRASKLEYKTVNQMYLLTASSQGFWADIRPV